MVWLCLVGLKYIRGRLSDDNVVESEKNKTPQEEVSAKNFPNGGISKCD